MSSLYGVIVTPCCEVGTGLFVVQKRVRRSLKTAVSSEYLKYMMTGDTLLQSFVYMVQKTD